MPQEHNEPRDPKWPQREWLCEKCFAVYKRGGKVPKRCAECDEFDGVKKS